MADLATALPVRALDLDIRDLLFAQDKVDASGSTGLVAVVSATNLDIRDLLFATDKVDASGSAVTVSATNLDIRDLLFASDKVDVSGSAITAVVSATDLDIRNLLFATDKVDVSGSTIFADFSDAVQAGAKSDYLMSAALAAGASANHDYTVSSGKTLLLKQILSAASGKIKVELLVGPVASLVAKATTFNSTADPDANIDLDQPIAVPDTSTGTVRVKITNLEASSMDVYSTILGNEV